MDQSRYHTTEDGRWTIRDHRVQEFRGGKRALYEDAMKKQLWPDQATYLKEEQRRFEISMRTGICPLRPWT